MGAVRRAWRMSSSSSLSSSSDTIFALSSGRGVAGVAVVRISGPGAVGALEALTPGCRLPATRYAAVRRLRHQERVLDEALVLRFAGPASFTGEDVVELHCHGGPATVDGVLSALSQLPRLRPAERGEFTRRAFAAGKLGVTQVEGLADLLAASTSRQRDQALRVMDGALEREYGAWRSELAGIRAAAEAAIDFGDEMEGEVDAAATLGPLEARARRLRRALARALGVADRCQAVRDGARVVLAGPPNAGKSSLVNLLAARPAAIVSDVAGTTRDVLEVRLNLAGFEVKLYDTAGIRDAADGLEAEGIRRAREACDAAHLVCYVIDAGNYYWGTDFLSPQNNNNNNNNNKLDLVVLNKVDLIEDNDAMSTILSRLRTDLGTDLPIVTTTAIQPDGADALLAAIETHLVDRWDAADHDDAPTVVRERHRRHVQACLDALDSALLQSEPELFAEDLRLATLEIGKLVGAIDVEDVLDSLFRDFCIGK
ncbi:hypothetical protein CTAYLR_003652 [Chrysophaeum taylorii]|uniref:tRNA modification GTPase n=1 Tax=Chrysophaeum taylorii TaxID=2483200 RepID=A0AAD7XK00_9STRA|nr:hypothetical protein CTAYLR_003652 [Chrysophaeum taylorii]